MPPSQNENWFFLRGLVREARHWGPFIDDFKAAFPERRVYCLDLPGNGIHWRKRTPPSIGEMTTQVREEFEKISRETPGALNFIVALSLGSMVALDWILSQPAGLNGAVLINTSLRGLNPWYQRFSLGALSPLAKILRSRNLREQERWILDLTSHRRDWSDSELESRAAIFREQPVSKANALRQILAAARYAPPSHPPQIPVLLLNSWGDKLVHPHCSETIQARWNLPLKSHPWAGHDLPLDDPRWTLNAIAEWYRGL